MVRLDICWQTFAVLSPHRLLWLWVFTLFWIWRFGSLVVALLLFSQWKQTFKSEETYTAIGISLPDDLPFVIFRGRHGHCVSVQVAERVLLLHFAWIDQNCTCRAMWCLFVAEIICGNKEEHCNYFRSEKTALYVLWKTKRLRSAAASHGDLSNSCNFFLHL